MKILYLADIKAFNNKNTLKFKYFSQAGSYKLKIQITSLFTLFLLLPQENANTYYIISEIILKNDFIRMPDFSFSPVHRNRPRHYIRSKNETPQMPK